MTIWFEPISLEMINKRSENTLSDLLDIQFTEITDDSITATMPVSDKIKQPVGIVHGGANVVLAETLASTAANYAVDLKNYYCVGLEINANHIRSVREGLITAITTPIHIGKMTHIWSIELFNQEGKKTCISRMTACVLPRNKL
ncbi:MAG: hotdog fold thioesterase [Legionellaceae bacterium]|nr:hotdog fold thioesterase [Legionellaceae bacterium]